MKLNNKILYLTATGLISTLIPANTNAQTFYQCMPITCSDGQYIKDGKCTSCPAGTFQKGNNRATSCQECKFVSVFLSCDSDYPYAGQGANATELEIDKIYGGKTCSTMNMQVSGCSSGYRAIRKIFVNTAVQYIGCSSSSGSPKFRFYTSCGKEKTSTYTLEVNSNLYCNPNISSEKYL